MGESSPLEIAVNGLTNPEKWASIHSSDELADCIAHDLIQPLSEIINNVWLCREFLGTSAVSSECHEALARIESQAMQTVELIRSAHKMIKDTRI